MTDFTLPAFIAPNAPSCPTVPFTKIAQVWTNKPEGSSELDWGLDEPVDNDAPFIIGATWQNGQWYTLGYLDAEGLAKMYPINNVTAVQAVDESIKEMVHDAHISGDTLNIQAVRF